MYFVWDDAYISYVLKDIQTMEIMVYFTFLHAFATLAFEKSSFTNLNHTTCDRLEKFLLDVTFLSYKLRFKQKIVEELNKCYSKSFGLFECCWSSLFEFRLKDRLVSYCKDHENPF